MLQDQSPREARSRPQTSLSLPSTLHVTTAPSGIHHGPDFGRRLEEASSVAGRRVLPLSHPRPPPTPPHAASLLLSLPIPLNHHCHTTPSQSPTSHRRILAVRTPSRLSNHAHGGEGAVTQSAARRSLSKPDPVGDVSCKSIPDGGDQVGG
jgi:hypothetical protein